MKKFELEIIKNLRIPNECVRVLERADENDVVVEFSGCGYFSKIKDKSLPKNVLYWMSLKSADG